MECQEETRTRLSEKMEALKKQVVRYKEELRSLRKELKQLRKYERVFGPHMQEWEGMRRELRQCKQSEKYYLRIIPQMTGELAHVRGEGVRKEEEILRLGRRVQELKNGMGTLNRGGGGSWGRGTGGVDPVTIFPEELWEIIFDHVEEDADLWSCYNSCRLFQRLLHDWKTTWLFDQAYPHLFRYLSGGEIVKCCEVSRGWEGVVQSYFEEHPSLRPYDQGDDPRLLPFVNPVEEKEDLEWVNRLVFKMGEEREAEHWEDISAMCLFFSRAVHLTISRGEEADPVGEIGPVWADLSKFFEKFGVHIFYLTVEIWVYKVYEESPRILQELARILAVEVPLHLENLRRFKLTWRWNILEDEWAQPGLLPLEALPSAPALETVEACFYSARQEEHSNPVLLALLKKYHAQLRRLRLPREAWNLVSPLGWPYLRELVIDDYQYSDFNHQLDWSQTTFPRLNKFGLHLNYIERRYMDYHLRNLHSLSTSTPLKALRFEAVRQLNAFVHFRVEVTFPPSLVTLELECSDYNGVDLRYYNLLLHFPHLQNLNLFRRRSFIFEDISLWSSRDRTETEEDWPKEVDWDGAVVVRLAEYFRSGQLYKSNLWELMPRLKVLTLQWDVFTREGYEEYGRKRENSFRAGVETKPNKNI